MMWRGLSKRDLDLAVEECNPDVTRMLADDGYRIWLLPWLELVQKTRMIDLDPIWLQVA
jgi:hypothetical protein